MAAADWRHGETLPAMSTPRLKASAFPDCDEGNPDVAGEFGVFADLEAELKHPAPVTG
jgi:hypothetical protein